jgi:hypothetical protein
MTRLKGHLGPDRSFLWAAGLAIGASVWGSSSGLVDTVAPAVRWYTCISTTTRSPAPRYTAPVASIVERCVARYHMPAIIRPGAIRWLHLAAEVSRLLVRGA